MDIRSDFKSVDMLLHRLAQYAKAFCSFEMEDWPHLKNNEDFRDVYSYPHQIRTPLEAIYADGRGVAIHMKSALVNFNDPVIYPTLKSYVDSFSGGWIYQIGYLNSDSQRAKDICGSLDGVPWAMERMICLYDKQIELLAHVKQTIEGLKQTDLYKWDSGAIQTTFPVPEYTKILECIHSVGTMFERLPSTYAKKDEESLRDHILVTLETLVTGTASGETFNKRGKTDILVRSGSVNEFIGECKFWHGKVGFLATISQLLSYLSWRDTNAAVIMFVSNKDFTAVLEKVENYVAEHHGFLKLVEKKYETWLNCHFRNSDDSSRVVNVAIMLYHTAE